MAIAANLGVSLTADVSKFQFAMKKSAKSVRRVRDQVKDYGRDIKRFSIRAGKNLTKFAAIGTAAALAITTAMVKSSLETIDALGKTSDRLGITTESLASLRHHAKLSGMSISTLEKSLQKLQIGMHEAAAGTGMLLPAITKLGLNIDDLINLQPDQVIGLIADEMNKLESQSEKTSVAFGIFGQRGVEMVTMLQSGSDGFKESARQAERLGLTISRIDAAAIEQANDSLERFKSLIVGVFNRLTVKLSPWITAIADQFTDMGIDGMMAFTGMDKAAEKLKETLSDISSLMKMVTGIAKIGIGIGEATTGVGALFGEIGSEILFGEDDDLTRAYAKFRADRRSGSEGLIYGGADDIASAFNGQGNRSFDKFTRDLTRRAKVNKKLAIKTGNEIEARRLKQKEIMNKKAMALGIENAKKESDRVLKIKLEAENKLEEVRKTNLKKIANATIAVFNATKKHAQAVSSAVASKLRVGGSVEIDRRYTKIGFGDVQKIESKQIDETNRLLRESIIILREQELAIG